METNNSVSIISKGDTGAQVPPLVHNNGAEGPPLVHNNGIQGTTLQGLQQSINPSAPPPGYTPNPQSYPPPVGPMQPQYAPPHQNQYFQTHGGLHAPPMYPGSGGGAPYYGPYGPPAGPYAPRPAPRQQQQQQVVVIGGATAHAPQPLVAVSPSFGSHFALACCVYWFGGFLFGLIAFILAAVGSSKARTDPKTARQYASASLAVSVAGIIVALVAIVVTISVMASMGVFSSADDGSSDGYYTKNCYNSYGLRVSCSSQYYG